MHNPASAMQCQSHAWIQEGDAKGPSLKYVTLEGRGSEKVWQGGQEHSHSQIFFIHMKHEIQSDV